MRSQRLEFHKFLENRWLGRGKSEGKASARARLLLETGDFAPGRAAAPCSGEHFGAAGFLRATSRSPEALVGSWEQPARCKKRPTRGLSPTTPRNTQGKPARRSPRLASPSLLSASSPLSPPAPTRGAVSALPIWSAENFATPRSLCTAQGSKITELHHPATARGCERGAKKGFTAGFLHGNQGERH